MVSESRVWITGRPRRSARERF